MAGIDAVRSYCGWQIAPSVSVTFKVEGDGGRVLLLPSLYITDVTEVRDEDGNVLPASDYKVRENGIARGRWCREVLYEFDVTHGYAEMPPEVQQVIEHLDAGGLGAGVLRSNTAGPFTQSYDLTGQPVTVRAVLDRYKLPPRP